jgi:hypothetical protein
MNADNSRVEIADDSRENFNVIISLIMANKKATYYAAHPANGLVLFWEKPAEKIYIPWVDGVKLARESAYSIGASQLSAYYKRQASHVKATLCVNRQDGG